MYIVGNDSRSLDASSSDCLEHIHHTFCLETLQLRVDHQECTTPSNTIPNRQTRSLSLSDILAVVMFIYLHTMTVCFEEALIRTLVSLSMSVMMADG